MLTTMPTANADRVKNRRLKLRQRCRAATPGFVRVRHRADRLPRPVSRVGAALPRRDRRAGRAGGAPAVGRVRASAGQASQNAAVSGGSGGAAQGAGPGRSPPPPGRRRWCRRRAGGRRTGRSARSCSSRVRRRWRPTAPPPPAPLPPGQSAAFVLPGVLQCTVGGPRRLRDAGDGVERPRPCVSERFGDRGCGPQHHALGDGPA